MSRHHQAIGIAAALAVAIGVSTSAMAQTTVVLPPIDAQAEAADGVNYSIDPNYDKVNCSRWDTLSLERRGILEFSLNAIPDGATIESAVFHIQISGFTASPSRPPAVIQFHGYAGNDVLEVADATVPFNPIGQTPEIDALIAHSIPFDTAYIQSLLGTGSALGVMTYQGGSGQADFYSTDAMYRPLEERPRLVVTYTLPSPETIEITKAAYNAKKSSLKVEAVSSFGSEAGLTARYVTGDTPSEFASMSYNARKGKWSISFSSVSPKPDRVEVRSASGSSAESVVSGGKGGKGGNGKPNK